MIYHYQYGWCEEEGSGNEGLVPTKHIKDNKFMQRLFDKCKDCEGVGQWCVCSIALSC